MHVQDIFTHACSMFMHARIPRYEAQDAITPREEADFYVCAHC